MTTSIESNFPFNTKWIPWIFAGLIAFTIIGFAVIFSLRDSKPAKQMANLTRPPLGKFAFYRESETPFNEQNLDGKTTIINFFFTQCMGPCPLMTSQLALLEKEFGDKPGFQIVSITINPGSDNAAALREYAKKYKIDLGNWAFLRAPFDQTVAFANQALGVPAGEDPALHTTRFILVNRERRIEGYFDSTDAQHLETLRARLRGLI